MRLLRSRDDVGERRERICAALLKHPHYSYVMERCQSLFSITALVVEYGKSLEQRFRSPVLAGPRPRECFPSHCMPQLIRKPFRLRDLLRLFVETIRTFRSAAVYFSATDVPKRHSSEIAKVEASTETLGSPIE